MSSNLDLTAMNAALKEIYGPQYVEDLVYRNNPFLALVPKDTDFVGEDKKIPVQTGASQGASVAFSTAQANLYAPTINAFLLTRKQFYSVGRLDRQTMLASASNRGSFLRAAKLTIDSALKTSRNTLASSLYRSGTGSIGLIAAGGITTGVITLDSPSTVVQFEIGQTLQASTADGSGLRAALGYVIAVNRAAGTVTVSTSQGGSAASPTSWAAGDYLLVQGNLNGLPSGLAGWLPTTAPSGSDNFYGVNRSVDPTRLAGVRYDGSTVSIEEGFTNALALTAREGGAPTHCFTNFSTYAALENSLGSKVQYDKVPGPASINFDSIKIVGPNGSINVVPDRNCPANTAYFLTLDSWCLESLQGAPHIVDDLGDGQWLRVSNEDAGEVRIAWYANLSCNAPGWNCVVTTSA